MKLNEGENTGKRRQGQQVKQGLQVDRATAQTCMKKYVNGISIMVS